MKIHRKIKSRVSRCKTLVREELEVLTGKRDRLTPPRRLIDGIGGGDFKTIGEEFFRYFREVAKLKPDERVLDVGCGCGRMALPLTRYLSGQGGYWGFDIVKDNITWCQKNIASAHPNFHFVRCDVFNEIYNPEGKFKASEYKFPYPDNFFDFVSLTSVFTHLLADDMLNYLREIARVLKPGGRSFNNYFILNDESRRHMSQGKGRIIFGFSAKDCMLWKRDFPEAAVGFEESFLRKHFAACGLEISDPIFYGSWSTGPSMLTYQDVILATKKP